MTREEHYDANMAAFRRLKPTIDSYQLKQFVAIANSKIVADDADIVALREKLIALDIDPMNSLVDRSGEEWAEELLIL